MAYRSLKTFQRTLNLERMGSQLVDFQAETWSGAPINMAGSTFHLWLGIPQPLSVITVSFTQVTPIAGFSTPALGVVETTFTEADLAAWTLPPGTWPYELLASNDGGVTMDKIAKGNIVVGSWITNTF